MAAGAAVLSILSPVAKATNFNWSSTTAGTYDWTNSTNWGGAGSPLGSSGNGDGANILINAGGAININLASGNYFVGSLSIGSTGSAQTIDVGNGNSGGGTITLDGGVPLQNGAGTAGVYSDIVSGGVAGSTNIISAPILLDQAVTYNGVLNGDTNSGAANYGNFLVHTTGTLNSVTFMRNVDTGVAASAVFDPSSTNDITLNGTISQSTGLATALCNAMSSTRTLTINGPILLANSASTSAQTFTLTGTDGSRTVVNGVISDGGTGTIHSGLALGNTNPSKTTVHPAISPTIVINSANTYTGLTTMNMATLVLGNNQAFGVGASVPNVNNGQITIAGSSNEYGYNFMSDNDARTIGNGIKLGQFLTIEGSHSLTLSGYLFQTSNRGVLNLLPAGKTMTYSGSIFASLNDARTWMFDGSGTTVVSGAIYNSATSGDESPDVTPLNNPVTKLGSGTLLLTGTGNTWRGLTTVSGGLMQFANAGSYGVQLAGFVPTGTFVGGVPTYSTGNAGTSGINVGTGGAVGVVTGSTDANFIAKINSGTSNSTGALALSPADAVVNIDFTNATVTNGAMGGTRTTGMSIGAGNTPVTYTGTITPFGTTYKLGGGGTLTLPNAQITGAGNSLVVTNGGTVALNGLNTYDGSTTIKGVYVASSAPKAASNSFAGPQGAFEPQVLSVSHLGPALAASSIGTSSTSASNLVISGGTLQYTGAGDTTDRLFTISPTGATLDASGTGPINFTNTGAIAETDAGTFTGTIGTAVNGGAPFNRVSFSGGPDTSQLAVGMTVTDSAGVLAPYAPVTITAVDSSGMTLSFQPTTGFTPTASTMSFTTQLRALTLTGTNTGANTLAAALTDSGAGTLGVNKSGPGTWILSGTSTYSGNTKVSGGLLEFTQAGAYGNTASITAGTDGAVGVDTGSTAAGFLAKITASATPSTGALALAAPDAAVNLDFTSSPYSGANIVGMSVGAVSGGTTYTGTITPAAGTYRLGGGGVLTLSNSNALTGGNAVTITNSGQGVVLTNSNDYTGITNVNTGSLTVAATGAITGSNTINVAAPATLNAIGSLPSTATVNANGATNFGGNTGTAPHTQQLAALSVGTGATATILASTFPFTPATLAPTALTFTGTGKLDVKNNIVIATGTPGNAEALIVGNQVVTTTSGLALGYGDAGGGKYEIRATLLGDTDLDGRVNVADLANLAGNFGVTSGANWLGGDLDYNGTVNVADLADLAGNFGQNLAAGSGSGGASVAAASSAALPAAATGSAVPEPTSLSLLGLGAAALLGGGRRRRRHRRC
jgi:fibronectin-binding autotransporter adhesin